MGEGRKCFCMDHVNLHTHFGQSIKEEGGGGGGGKQKNMVWNLNMALPYLQKTVHCSIKQKEQCTRTC